LGYLIAEKKRKEKKRKEKKRMQALKQSFV
jgi:hypothetical protein